MINISLSPKSRSQVKKKQDSATDNNAVITQPQIVFQSDAFLPATIRLECLNFLLRG